MKEIAGAIIVVLGIVVFVLFSSGRIDIDRKEGWIDWDPTTPQSTLDAGDAAANATMVAQQQSAQMTASAAQSEMQATAQAAAAQATKQAMVADQARLDQAATKRAESTAKAVDATVWAAQVTAEHERFVATATSAAEATRIQATAIAAMATRQIEVDDMTATVESRNATATRQATKRIEREKDQRHAIRVGKLWLLVVFFGILTAWGAWLLCQCLKYAMEYWMKCWPSTLRALLFIWKRHGGKECKKKTTPS